MTKLRNLMRCLAILITLTFALSTKAITGFMYEYKQLASSTLSVVCQDKYGFIWTSTDFGLSKFDGYHFSNYYHVGKDTTSIASNLITTLNCLSDGTMLVGSSKGLMSYDYATNHFFHYQFPQGIKPRIASIVELDKNIYVFTSGHGVFTIRLGSKVVRHSTAFEQKMRNKYPRVISTERDGHVWASTSDGRLLRFKIAHGVPTAVVEICREQQDPVAVTEVNGQIMLFYAKKIVRFNPQTNRLLPTDYQLPRELTISSVSKTPSGEILLGSLVHGLYIIRRGSKIALSEPLYNSHYKLQGVDVNHIFFDRENNLWMAIPHHGLYFCSTQKRQFTSWDFILQGERLSNGITSIAPADEEGLLCVMQSNGLFHVDKNGNIGKYSNAPTNCNVIYRDRQGKYWLAANRVLYHFNPQNGMITQVNDLGYKETRDITEDKQGHLFVSLIGGGFYMLDHNGKTLRHYNTHILPKKKGAKFGNDWVEQIFCDHFGMMWIATASGVWCYDPVNDYFVDNGTGDGVLREYIVSCINELPDHNIVIGTQSGLYLCQRNLSKITRLPGCQKLEDMQIGSLKRDQDGNFWISTPKGIWLYNYKKKQLISYAGDNGISEDEFLTGSAFQADNGTIYLGAVSTLTFFQPNELKKAEKVKGHVYLTQATSPSAFYNPFCSKITVPWDDNRITLEFSLLDYKNLNVNFEYRMNNGKWTAFDEGKNSLTFAKLKPGTYQVEVRAMKGGYCISDIQSVVFEIEAPWYASTSAKMAYALFAIILIYGLALHFYRRQKANFEEEKMKLLINATHDIRSPLTLILGPIEKIKGLVEKNCSEEARQVIGQYINTIDRNAERLLSLVNQILDMRKIDKNQMSLRCRETDLVGFVKKACQSFEFIAEDRGINLHVESSESPLMVWIDRTNFDKVVVNLLANAFKYTLDGGEIFIRIQHDEQMVTLDVTDSGMGFGDEKVSKLFERFYQGKNNTSVASTGIGLNLVMSIVKLHGGDISASNRTDGNRGATFTIKLPLGNSHLSNENIYVPLDEEKKMQKSTSKKARIALVDDDSELQSYVAQELSIWYQIDCYSNGIDAMHALLAQDYDIVVSDVMMPGMDGISLLKKIKQNPKTNHIPVILLTSKSEVEDRLSGIKNGADAYLTKPFDIDELHAHIDNLIDSILRLRGKFSGAQQQLDKVEQIEVTGYNDEMMKNVMDSINRHINDSEYSVEVLASEVGVSRVHLHRKLKEMTGLSAGKFIRNIRMEQARQLIVEGKINIAQIAYEVGFCDPAHFSTVFKQYYGMPPSEYAKQNKA